MDPLGAVITTALALLVLGGSRAVAATSLIAAVCYLPQSQHLDLAGVNLSALRMLLVTGLVRVFGRGELRLLRLNAIDRTQVMYALSILLIPTLRVRTAQEFVYQIGVFGDVLTAYFFFSSVLRERQDLRKALAILGVVVVPFACLMTMEVVTGRNPFSVFAGVQAFTWVRDGSTRGTGPFRNPITAGSFGVTFALLFASTVFASGAKWSERIGLVCSLVVVVCAHSSGPTLGLLLGVAAFACWNVREHTRAIRWLIVGAVAGLSIVMKAPVWFLIARIGDYSGGNAYHRAFLIEQFVDRFNTWWLAGTSDLRNWFPYTLADGSTDVTNRFVADGLQAGLIGMALSIGLMTLCFQRIGNGMKAVRGRDPETEKFLWGIGSTLVATIAILFSVTYFDQMSVIWCFLLACIARIDVVERPSAVRPRPDLDQIKPGRFPRQLPASRTLAMPVRVQR
jgi:hypothetical protein